jgi:hypothetical protein
MGSHRFTHHNIEDAKRCCNVLTAICTANPSTIQTWEGPVTFGECWMEGIFERRWFSRRDTGGRWLCITLAPGLGLVHYPYLYPNNESPCGKDLSGPAMVLCFLIGQEDLTSNSVVVAFERAKPKDDGTSEAPPQLVTFSWNA